MSYKKFLFGSCYRDIGKAALLLQLRRLVKAHVAWENIILRCHDKYRPEFQTLGAVHGHKRHAVCFGVVAVKVGHQRHLLQKIGQRCLGIFLQQLHGIGFQLVYIFHTCRSLVALRFQHLNIAALLRHRFDKLVKPRVIRKLLQLVEQICGGFKRLFLTHKRGQGIRAAAHVNGACSQASRDIDYLIYRCVADTSLRLVDYSAESDLIVRIVYNR